MIGVLLSGLASAGSRAGIAAFSVGVWLMSRPGGWAVLVVLILLALRFYPSAAPAAQ